VNPQLKAAGTAGSIDNPQKFATLNAYDLLPTTPLHAATGLDLKKQFGIDVGDRDFRGTPLPSGPQTGLGALAPIVDPAR
jgi:hypothetical protein